MKNDRNLLFGVLAVQLNKVTPAQFAAAAGAWAADSSQALHEHLVARGVLSEADCRLILRFVNAAVDEHGGDEAAALTDFGGYAQARKSLAGGIALDPDGNYRVIGGEALTAEDINDLPTLDEAKGRYTHISEYGRGGMGRVLLIHDQYLGRDVALKELLPEVSPDASTVTPGAAETPGTPVRNLMPFVHRFLQEARITGQLEHPSIVPVYEVGRRIDGHLYYTMKLVRGRTMGKALRERDTLDKRMALLPNFLDLCHAIAYAHAQKVIHRDIKPENVMVGDFGETVVIDWGLAKVLDKEDVHADSLRNTIRAMRVESYRPTSTQYGDALGTPAYMPPEQARGELDRVNEQSDVYSLGAVLYELLTGAAPFDGPVVKDIIAKVSSQQPKAIRDIVPDAPPELVAICERAMSPDQAKRYANGSEMAAEIDRYQSGALVQAYRYPFSDHLKRFVNKHRPILLAAAISAVALMALAVFSYIQVTHERDFAVNAHHQMTIARDKEQQQREQAERQLYLSCLYLARQSIEHKDYDVAAQALERAPESLRQWEWTYYSRLCQLDEHTLAGHQGAVTVVAYSLDGARLVTASDDGTGKVWDAASGSLLATLSGHTDELRAATFSPDGEAIVTGSDDASARVWEVQTGKSLFVLAGHTQGIVTAEFSRQGKRVVTASDDGTAKIWSWETGKEIFTLTGHSKALRSASFSPDGARVVTASADATARVWDASTGKESRSLTHGGAVVFAGFSPDGKWILTASADGVLHFWSADSGTEEWSNTDPSKAICRPAFSPDGSRIVCAYSDGRAVIYDTHGAAIPLFEHQGATLSARFSPDGASVVTASMDRTARVFDAVTGAERFSLVGHSGAVHTAVFSPDGTHIATGSSDGLVKMWNAKAPSQPALTTFNGHARKITLVAINADGNRLLSGAEDGSVLVWDLVSGGTPKAMEGHRHQIIAAAYSKDGKQIVTASSDGTVITRNADTGKPIATIAAADRGKVLSGAEFSPDGRSIVTASMDNTAGVWDAATGAQRFALTGHTGPVWKASYSHDGTKVVTASGDKTARIWDATTGTLLFTLTGHADGLPFAAFSPDDTLVVTTSLDKTAKLWNTSTGKETATLAGHKLEVRGADFLADGKTVVTYAANGTTRIWDTASGTETHALVSHGGGVTTMAVSPDNLRVITASLDGKARLWDVASGSEMAVLSTYAKEVRGVVFTPDGKRIVTASGNCAEVWGR